MQDMTLVGRRALVTGGGSGLGAEIARSLASAGAEVVVSGRQISSLTGLAIESERMRPITVDVTDENSVRELFAKAGPTDIVIANAGIVESSSFEATTLQSWNEIQSTNLAGVFLTLREGLRQMRGWGRLIAIASTAGLKGIPYAAAYCASKHGVIGLVRSVAHEVARREVTVNAICPGYLDTEMTARTIDRIASKTGLGAEAALERLARANPQGRLIRTTEVAAAVLWLCGPGSEGINGQAISISGGET